MSLAPVSQTVDPVPSTAVTRSALAWVFAEPSGWSRTRDPDSGLYGELYEEQAVVHGRRGSGFYLRGNLEIPVVDAADDLLFVVWVAVSGTDFERARGLWNDPRREEEPPYPGLLCNRIPGYSDTWHLRVRLRSRAVGLRPVVELEPSEHPLAVDQERGVRAARAVQIVNAFDEALEPRVTTAT